MKRLAPELGAALGCLLLYALTLAPGLTSEDAGELVAAAATLGVPHPPGFPLWVLLVHVATSLSPASPAWTANLASAVFAAGTVGALVHVGRQLGASAVAAVAAALLVGTGSTFWSQAVIAEVYSLNTLTLALALASILRWGRAQPDGGDRGLWWAALWSGLGLTNHHPLTLLAGPAFAAYAITRSRGAVLRPARLLRPALALLVPQLLYLYLPWAASRRPAVNWGDPSTASAAWAHVSRQAYRGLELSQQVTMDDKLGFGLDFLHLWLSELTLLGLLGALVGAWTLWRGRRDTLVLLVGIFGFGSFVLLGILRFEHEPENIMRVNEYYLPVYVVSGAMIAVGLDALLGLAKRSLPARLALGVVTVGLVGWRLPAADMSEYHLTEDYNRHLLASLPEDAIFFPSGDYVSFPSLYLLTVEGLRPDVLLANYTGAPSYALRDYVASIGGPRDGDAAKLQDSLLSSSERPVIFASKSDVRAQGFQLRPWGLAFRAYRPGEPRPPGPELISKDVLRHLVHPGPVDDLGRSVLADYHRAMMEAHLGRGDRQAALQHLRLSEAQLSNSKEGLNNLGSTAAEYGMNDDALRLFEAAAALSARYVTPRRNRAMLLDQLGRTDEAIEAFRVLVRVAPADIGAKRRLEQLEHPDPALERVRKFEAATRAEPLRAPLWNNLGTAYVEARRPEDARRAYLEAIRVDPSYPLAHKHLAALFREFFDDPAAAARHEAMWQALRAPR